MPTQCSRDLFGYEVVDGREVVAAFDGGEGTTDAGGLLLGATDRTIDLVGRFAACFVDHRAQAQVEHTVTTMVAQRVFGIALGYEDLIDHDHLRHDPVLAVLAGKLAAKRQNCAPLAGKSTLNRLEHAPLLPSRYHKISHDPGAIEALFVDLFLEAHKTPPGEIILDLDATDDPLHGHQEGRFFHGYYDCYCYLPLYVFCGRHLLAAKLRRSNIDASAGAVAEVERIVGRIRTRWPQVKILLRADSGFARDELMAWCEANGVDYVCGLARNERLVGAIADDLAAAELGSLAQGSPARRFADFFWRTRDSWSRARRVVAKAEHLPKGANPRFVVTSLPASDIDARTLYEDVYCARGEVENRIKEQLGRRNGVGAPFPNPAAKRSLCRSHVRGDHARQPAATLVRVVRLRPARGATPDRSAPHSVRDRHLRHHPAQAAEDRRPGAEERAPDQDCHGLGLPLPDRVPPRPSLPEARHLLSASAWRPPPGARAGVARPKNHPSTGDPCAVPPRPPSVIHVDGPTAGLTNRCEKSGLGTRPYR
jgi:Transposase DDE domain group 1